MNADTTVLLTQILTTEPRQDSSPNVSTVNVR